MALSLLIDGGGTKILALLMDENYCPLGRGKSGGINPNSRSREECIANTIDCLQQVFAGHPPETVDQVIVSYVGDTVILKKALLSMTKVLSFQGINEPTAGLLTACYQKSGLAALAGTGSDVFYVSEKGRTSSLGGWGFLLGDEGGGAWLGRRALEASIRCWDGWGPDTILPSLILSRLGLHHRSSLIPKVYGQPKAGGLFASLAPAVGQAAREGDQAALDILHEGGTLLARQALSLIRQNEKQKLLPQIALCGGAWRCHPALFLSFRSTILESHPDFEIVLPHFHMLLAGALLKMMERQLSKEEAFSLLERNYPEDVIHWPEIEAALAAEAQAL